MADVVDHWRPETEDAAMVSPKEVAIGNGFDHNGDVSDILAFDHIGANVDGTTNGFKSGASQVEIGESSKHVGEVVEEEIVELEFEKVKPKLATHSMHCPYCKSEITKVTLRRKVLLSRDVSGSKLESIPKPEPKLKSKPKPGLKSNPDPELESKPEPELEPKHELESTPKPDSNLKKLFGCFACLRVFTCSENGCFNPFDLFGKTPETDISAVPVSQPSTGEIENSGNISQPTGESCFSMFWVIRKGKTKQEPDELEPSEEVDVNPRVIDPSQAPSPDTMINIENETETVVDAQSRGRPWLGYEGVLVDILKSVVYGGLMEVIASLSVVASAASSDASTLSLVSLALASLIGGVFIIGHNLWDLRADCYKDSLTNEAANKYKEQLGHVDYFPLHAFFAILSFLVFGLVPPVAYGVSFHETNDKDYTIMAVAIASLLCVVLLAISKAYINKCTVLNYFKTVVYYITVAVSVSGVSYVAGNLFTRLMEEYGLFDTSSGGGMALLSHASTPSLASF